MEILNIKEVSEYLHCSISTIRKLIRANQIPYFRIGNRLLFNREQIDNWIFSQTSNTMILEQQIG